MSRLLQDGRVRSGLLMSCVILSALLPAAANAQRAECYGRQDAPRFRTPTSDFPGLFDANLAAKGTVVGYLPWHSALWGVTDQLTVGTNLLYALPLVAGDPGGLLLARYRVYSSPSVQTVLDGMLGGFRIDDRRSDEHVSHSLATVGVHSAIALSAAHELTASAVAGNFTFALDRPQGLEDIAINGLGLGLTYAWIPAHWFSVRGFALLTPIVAGVVETRSFRTEENIAASASMLKRLVYRAHVSFRAGRHWLFELGVVGAGRYPLPWLNVGIRIG